MVNLSQNRLYQDYLSYTEEYLIRFTIQTIMFVIWYQVKADTHTILK